MRTQIKNVKRFVVLSLDLGEFSVAGLDFFCHEAAECHKQGTNSVTAPSRKSGKARWVQKRCSKWLLGGCPRARRVAHEAGLLYKALQQSFVPGRRS